MPKFQITAPDGQKFEIIAPDGATQDQVLAYAQQNFKPKAPIKDNLNAETLNPTIGMSGTDKFLAGAGKAFSDIGRGAKQLVGMGDQGVIDEAKRIDKPLMDTGAGMAGNIAGNVAATAAIPGASSYAGAAGLGAALGAMQPVASDESRLQNVGIGAAGGAAGQGLANALGRLARPVQSTLKPELAGLAAKAQAAGIPLDIAQQTGSKPLQIINSVLDNLPFTADKQAAQKTAQRAAFNKAILAQVGENADSATPEVLNAARTRIGSAFNDLSARNNVALGDDFVNSLAAIEGGSNVFTKPAVRDTVDKALELAAQGQISGQTYQKVRSTLGKQAKDAFNSGNSEVGQALKAVQNALDDAATASIAPADKAAWAEARKQWGNLKAVEQAAAPTSADAVAGNVSAAKLAQALMKGNKQGMIYGTGDQAMPDLARIGQAFIKEQIPNSGTAQRAFYQDLLTNPMKIIPGALGGAAIPVQTLMNSKTGQAYLTQKAPGETAKMLADALRRASISGTATGALQAQ